MKCDETDLDEIDEAVSGGAIELRSNEDGFLDSVRESLEEGEELTAKQRKWMADIKSRIPAW